MPDLVQRRPAAALEEALHGDLEGTVDVEGAVRRLGKYQILMILLVLLTINTNNELITIITNNIILIY